MEYSQKTVTLKDGREAILRVPRTEDAPALLDYLKAIAAETEFVIKYPEECEGMTVEMEERFIRGMIDSPLSLMIVCEVDGRIAGNCSLQKSPRIKYRHRGEIGIALYKEFWGLGIGTALMRELIDVARAEGLVQLELDFIEGNERGRALYEKVGFEVVAVLPDKFMLKDGRLLKEYHMLKKL